ncbi:MAG: antirestriction protein ArdA [Aestuariibacter sp.]
MSHDIQIYVADLAAYNAGYLHGVWIDATLSTDDIQNEIQAMLAKSPVSDAEEYAIHDYEGFEGVSLSEWEGLDSVHQMANFIEEHGALAAGLINHFDDVDTAIKAIDDGYHGCYESLADYAQQVTEDCTTIPQHLQYYIDYESMARDWDMSGDIFTIELVHDELHVFSNI